MTERRKPSMPEGAEAVRAERAARRAEQARAGGTGPAAPVPDTGEGAGIIRSSWIGTGIFVVGTALAAGLAPLRLPLVVVDLVLFFGGVGAFLWALTGAAGRSREYEIGLWSLFLLEGAAPRRVRQLLLGALGAEIVMALAFIWVNAAMAFGILVPLWGLAHCGLWSARYGTFPPRRPSRRSRVTS
jgi:hypothetical protein